MARLPSLSTTVRSLGLPDRLVRAVEELQAYLRIRSTGLDAYVSQRDLIEWGFATEPDGTTRPPNTGGLTPVFDPGDVGSETPDLTPPPAPTGLTATGGYGTVFLEWDVVIDSRIGFFEVWRASVNNIGDAVKIGQTTSFLYVDNVQSSATFYYWVRAVNKWDVTIVSPFNAVGGTPATTSPDVAYLLGLLTGQLSESQLSTDLNSRIDTIGTLQEQMLTLSAGIGEQFDSFRIWYFDTGIESWGGNGTPTASGGFIRPANHGSDAYITSPTGLAAPGDTYPQVKFRLKRTGAPTWEGHVWWRTASTDPWSLDKRFSFTEPAFDGDGLAVETVTIPWTGNIDSIRIDLTSASSDTDHIAFDWIAIGRAAPGASVLSVQQEASARAAETGALFGKYTVKIDSNGYVTGYGLALTDNDGTPTSEFAIVADKFSIAPVATSPGAADGSPFFHLTVPATIGGVTVPAGTYMKAAYIHDASITNAKIGNLAVDNAKIADVSAGKLLAGTLAVGQWIASQGYSAGTSGWRINADGTAEFSSATIRGTIYASLGAIGGIAIGSTYIQSNYVPGSSGFRLNSDGTAEFSNLTARGNITANTIVAGASIVSPVIYSALNGGYVWPAYGVSGGYYLGPSGLLLGNGNGGTSGYFQVTAGGDIYAPQFSIVGGSATFSGALSAATGTFAGSLTAAAVNAVNTVNIAGEAVTIPRWAGGTAGLSLGTLVSASIDSLGQPVIILFSAEIYDVDPVGGTGAHGCIVKLYRDGLLLTQMTVYALSYMKIPLSLGYRDVPASGARTYSVVMEADGISDSDNSFAANRSLTLLGCKR